MLSRFFIAVMPVVNKYLYVCEREHLLARLFLWPASCVNHLKIFGIYLYIGIREEK